MSDRQSYKLTPKQRAEVTARRMAGEPVATIAASLGVSRQAIYYRLAFKPQERRRPVPDGSGVAYTLDDAGRVFGLGRRTLYRLIEKGALDARKSGRRTLLIGDSLRAYIGNLPPA